jgi:hypothetical protein
MAEDEQFAGEHVTAAARVASSIAESATQIESALAAIPGAKVVNRTLDMSILLVIEMPGGEMRSIMIK